MTVEKSCRKGWLTIAVLLLLGVFLTCGFAAPEQTHDAKVIFYVA